MFSLCDRKGAALGFFLKDSLYHSKNDMGASPMSGQRIVNIAFVFPPIAFGAWLSADTFGPVQTPTDPLVIRGLHAKINGHDLEDS